MLEVNVLYLFASSVNVKVLHSLSKGFANIDDMKKCIYWVSSECWLFINIISRYFLHNCLRSFFTQATFFEIKVMTFLFLCNTKEFNGLSQWKFLLCSSMQVFDISTTLLHVLFYGFTSSLFYICQRICKVLYMPSLVSL